LVLRSWNIKLSITQCAKEKIKGQWWLPAKLPGQRQVEFFRRTLLGKKKPFKTVSITPRVIDTSGETPGALSAKTSATVLEKCRLR
jgi:hypothetical protein